MGRPHPFSPCLSGNYDARLLCPFNSVTLKVDISSTAVETRCAGPPCQNQATAVTTMTGTKTWTRAPYNNTGPYSIGGNFYAFTTGCCSNRWSACTTVTPTPPFVCQFEGWYFTVSGSQVFSADFQPPGVCPGTPSTSCTSTVALQSTAISFVQFIGNPTSINFSLTVSLLSIMGTTGAFPCNTFYQIPSTSGGLVMNLTDTPANMMGTHIITDTGSVTGGTTFPCLPFPASWNHKLTLTLA